MPILASGTPEDDTPSRAADEIIRKLPGLRRSDLERVRQRTDIEIAKQDIFPYTSKVELKEMNEPYPSFEIRFDLNVPPYKLPTRPYRNEPAKNMKDNKDNIAEQVHDLLGSYPSRDRTYLGIMEGPTFDGNTMVVKAAWLTEDHLDMREYIPPANEFKGGLERIVNAMNADLGKYKQGPKR